MKDTHTCASHKCFRVLAGKTRLRILSILQEGCANVATITKRIGCTQPTISHHLKLLSTYGYVGSEKKGKETVYFFNKKYPCRKCGIIKL